jgi:hypothetical protein
MARTMDDLLSGKLGHFFLVSIIDAALVSLLVFWWYRRSVRTLMGRTGASVPQPITGAPFPAGSPAPAPGAGPLLFVLSDAPGAESKSRVTGPGILRLVAAYAAGAVAFAAGMVALQLGSDGASYPPAAWFSWWWIYLWPIVPSLMLLLAFDRASGARAAATYVIAGVLLCVLVTLGGQVVRLSFNSAPLTNPYYMLLTMAVTIAFPLPLVLATGWRRIRAVMPLALATTLLFGMALLLVHEIFTRAFNHPRLREWILELAALTSENGAYYVPYMLIALPVGGLAWFVLRRLARGFERKQFSDVQLIVDCWWFVVTVELMSTTLATAYGLWAIPAGLGLFAAYRASVALVLRLWKAPSVAGRPRLLLLRVFGYQARTESLFDRIVQRWRFRGPVQLIAGVDLAAKTVDPGDILAFIQGHLARQYVATTDAVAERLARLDLDRDPDGRFRVNEVYCHDDTWRAALQGLLDASDVVLMDLRSFSAQNAGCLFELGELMKRVATERIVLVYDRTTDLQLLSSTLSEAWATAVREGRARGSGQVGLVRVDQQSRAELGAVMQRLTGGAATGRVLTPADLASAGAAAR